MKRKTKFIICASLIILILAAAFIFVFLRNREQLPKKIVISDTEIITDEGLQIIYDTDSDVSINGSDSALMYLESISDYLSINPSEDLNIVSQDSLDSSEIYRFQQIQNGIPIFGRNIILEYDSVTNNKLVSDGSLEIADLQNIDIDEDIIREVISKDYGTLEYRTGGKTYLPIENEVYLTSQVYVDTENGQKIVFINHEDKSIVKELSLVFTQTVMGSGEDVDGYLREFPTEKENNKYLMYDLEDDIQAYDAHNSTVLSNDRKKQVVIDSKGKIYRWEDEGDYLQDEDGNRFKINCGPNNYLILKTESGSVHDDKAYFGMWLSTKNPFINVTEIANKSTSWKDTKAVTAYSNVQISNDFWKLIMNRNGFNNRDGRINLVINDYMGNDKNIFSDSTNAYSSTSSYGGYIVENGYRVDIPVTLLSFGTDNSLSLDTVAHEYMHSVERSISRLDYEGESGAIMEAYSDLFGEIVEDWNDNNKLDGSCNWIHSGSRNLSDPNSTELPDTYYGKYWHDTDNPSEENDHGGVHTNNTVISKAAYLMYTGIGNSPIYEKLTVKEIADIFYKALYLIPNSDCSFKQLRYLIEQQAILNGLSQKQRDCVSNAFFQVGITLTEDERQRFSDQQKNLGDSKLIESNNTEKTLEESFKLPLTFMTCGSHWGTKVGITGNYRGGIEYNYTHYQTEDKRVTDVVAYEITTQSKYSSEDKAWIITVTDAIDWSAKICEDRNKTSDVECIPIELNEVESAPSIFDELYLYPIGTNVSDMLVDCRDDLLIHYPNIEIVSNGILQKEVLYNKTKNIFYYNLGDMDNSASIINSSETNHQVGEKTIKLTTYEDLLNIKNNLDANYVLENDIDCQGKPLESIGSDSNPFTGTFEGNGNTISNFRIHFITPEEPSEQDFDIGFFGKIDDAAISGLNLDDCVISAVGSKANGTHFVNAGGLVGLAKKSSITNCNVKGLIVNNTEDGYYNRASGICCIAIEESHIKNCSFEGSIQYSSSDFNTMIAGVTSWLNESTISDCNVNARFANTGNSSLLYLSGISASGERSSVKNCNLSASLQELESLNADYFDKISNFASIENCNFEDQ